MARFRQQKLFYARLCSRPDWKAALEAVLMDAQAAKMAVSPLLALLFRPEARWQAAYALGLAVPLMAVENMESARIVMRRLMWSLNEESGNLGWGIPEAMASILAKSSALADEYARIFLSYGYQASGDDNFLDYAPLREGVCWGIGHLAASNPLVAKPALPGLMAALADTHTPLRALAAWSLAQMARHAPPGLFSGKEGKKVWQSVEAALKIALEQTGNKEGVLPIAFFDGEQVVVRTLYSFLEEALEKASRRAE